MPVIIGPVSRPIDDLESTVYVSYLIQFTCLLKMTPILNNQNQTIC